MSRPSGLARAAAMAAVAALLLSGCGSRLPERDFSGAAPAPGSPSTASAPITVGIVTSLSSLLGTDTFSGPLYGAEAFFRALNASGGLNGSQIKVVTCDDSGSGSGNQTCVHQLIDQDHVVALVATSALDYAGAPYVSSQGVPDVGGEPIGTAYDQYQHLYAINGSSEPRDGRSVGWNGTEYQTTEVYRYFRQKLGLHSAAVISYNQADSARYAAQLVQGLKAEGYQVLNETVDFALPNFGAVAAGMKAQGTQLLLDAMDTRGNVALCQAMTGAGVSVAAKVTNVQNWSAQTGSDYGGVPGCLNALWVTSGSRNYEDVRYPAVAAFRAAMRRYFPDREAKLSQWELEGYAAAQWFTDAAASCGATVDRACVDAFMQRPQPYDAHGLLIPADFVPTPPPTGPQHACLDVARWQNGGWVTQVPDMNTNCFEVPALPFRP
ncbi:ABC transporter substrate-binding protein [Streptacidiphilus sp. EB129]|uniref:ABC transporter substrate-binding protein n=1 Tax=Streptacidiphilus sp. EB129 TaxID=3156262 RepID=UPI003518D9E7